MHHWFVCLRNVWLGLNPVGAVHDALTWSLRESLAGPPSELRLAAEDREMVEHRLAALPEVAERDFHSLCTRVETLEVAVAALRDQMVAAGTADVVFDEDDYASELGDPSLAD